MTDEHACHCLLHGLPPNFRDFKDKYDWIRSTKPDEPPDLDYLYERLHVEEAQANPHEGRKEGQGEARKGNKRQQSRWWHCLQRPGRSQTVKTGVI